MFKQYETVFIMTPVLSDDQMKETVKKFENILREKGAEIIHQENWGLRKLEYQIQKKSTGFYQLFEFKADPQVVAELELQYRRDEKIMRYLTVALDKDAIAYAEKRRTHNFGQKKEVKPEVPAYEMKREPKPEPKFEPKPEVKPEPKSEPIAEPIIEPITEVIPEPVIEPVIEPANEPVQEPEQEQIQEQTQENKEE